jgi:CRP-like cAMP-binding protein
MNPRARLAAIPWFARLEPAVRDHLVASGRVVRRAAGDWLYGEGDEDTGLIAVLSGGLYMHAAGPATRAVLIGFLPEGSVIGQSIVFGGGPRLVTTICATPSELFVLSDRALRETAAAHDSLWPALSALIYDQLRASMRVVVEFIAMSPRERLISRLCAYAAAGPRIRIGQSALAETIGASRNAVNGWLGEMEAQKIVARGYRYIDVIDRDRLRKLAPLAELSR